MTGESDAPTFVDTHAHLDDGRFEHDVDAVLAEAGRRGVRHVVNIGYRPLRWRTTIALAKRQLNVSFTLGLHPHHADEFTPALLSELEGTIATSGAKAVGEIGLDYVRDFADRAAQREAFEAQLDLAHRLRLPVVIHQRGAEDDLRRVLEQTSHALVCILHSFDGTRTLADFALDRGYFCGVGGLMTKAQSGTLRDVIRVLPLERLVLETDAPYLVPSGVKDRRNSPVNVPLIAEHLARLKGVPVAAIARETTATAVRLFGLPTCLSDLEPATIHV